MVWMDGSSNQNDGGVEVVIQSPKGDVIECAVHLQFPITNNKVDYKAPLTSLDLVKVAGALLVVIHNDSQVIIGHVNRDYKSKGEQKKKYLSFVKK